MKFYIWAKPGEMPDVMNDQDVLVHPDEQDHECVHEFEAETIEEARSYYKGYMTRWWEVPDTFSDVRAFHRMCDLPHPEFFTKYPGLDSAKLRIRLIEEEVDRELLPALRLVRNLQCEGTRNPPTSIKDAMVDLVDGIVDSMYVIVGTAVTFGVPLHDAWREVQRSNMEKAGPDGHVIKRDDGKILKPDGWQPPDLRKVLGFKRH